VRFDPRVRAVVLTIARAVRMLALLSGAAVVVLVVDLYSDGVSGLDVIVALVLIAPPVVLWLLWAALRELAELPDRLKRLPETARERKVDVDRLAAELREPGRRLIRLPRTLWRLRVLVGAARDLATPHAPLLPFLSVTFLSWSAIAAGAAVAEIVLALVVLVAAVL
jgi:hypothetical protein